MRSRGADVRHRLRRGVYLLPSAFTIGNLFLGFWAVMKGLRGDFANAALLVIAAGVLDSLDGRIARLTHTESDFGREYDSLADVVTFGLAPALLAYLWGLQHFGRAGWLVPFFFMVCAATRLARFNVQSHTADSRWFAGLPVPAAAGGVVSILYFAPDSEWRNWLGAAMFLALGTLGVLMVSTFRYPSFKKLDLRERRSYRTLLLLAAGLAVTAFHPHAFFLVAATLYAAAGPLGWVRGRLAPRDRRVAPGPLDEKPG